jgi:hypothetical protein
MVAKAACVVALVHQAREMKRRSRRVKRRMRCVTPPVMHARSEMATTAYSAARAYDTDGSSELLRRSKEAPSRPNRSGIMATVHTSFK